MRGKSFKDTLTNAVTPNIIIKDLQIQLSDGNRKSDEMWQVPMLRKKKLAGSFLVLEAAIENGMSVRDAVLSLISTIVGGGIVGLPYAYYHCGIVFGIIFSLFISLMTHRSCILLLKAKDMVPGDVE